MNNMDRYDVIVIGKGPAGLSAAVYTARANLRTLIVGKDGGSLQKAGQIENYFGFALPVNGSQLLEAGQAQAQHFGAVMLDDEVTSVDFGDGYVVRTQSGEFEAPAVLIATGKAPRRPPIAGVQEFEGRGVAYCTTCDGFFYRNKAVGVLGNGNYAVQEAMELAHFTGDITIYTNGKEPAFTGLYREKATAFRLDTSPVVRVEGDDVLRRIVTADGTTALDGLFVALGAASSVDIATKLGVETADGSIVVDSHQRTNLEGVFAAGDCCGGFRQVSTAVGQGAEAANGIIEHVRQLKKEKASA